MKSPTELAVRFRAEGRKVTPQRQAIFGVLHGSSAHPTAEWVHDQVTRQMPTVSLRTVYQTLNDLTAMGELGQIRVGHGPTRFDPNLAPHHHLVCDVCHRVVDLSLEFQALEVPTERAGGFEVTDTEIVFRGRCSTCAAPGGPPHPQPTNQPMPQEAPPRHG